MLRLKENPLMNGEVVNYVPINVGMNGGRNMMFAELLDSMKDGEIRKIRMDLKTATALYSSAQYSILNKLLPYEWFCWRRRLSYLTRTDIGILFIQRIKYSGVE